MNSKVLLSIAALIGWNIFCDYWWCKNYENCGCNETESTAAVAAEATSSTTSNDLITFNANAIPTLGAGWASFSDSIINLVKGGKRIEILGKYGSKEVNNTKFENLGLGRADTIKNMLLAKMQGISASRVGIKSTLDESLNGASGAVVASSIAVLDTIATPSAQGGVVQQDEKHALIYFPSGSSAKEASKEVDDYLTQLAGKLKANNQTAAVIGHTDNKGNPAANVKLSQERADFVKGILVSHGADAAKLSTEGKGDKEPIGDNGTDAGRRQNRRVEIAIQ